MRKLYPYREAYNQGQIKVSDLHTIHFEESGNPKGKPILFLHGGPGSSCSPVYRQYFHPDKWRLVMFDQRGCGKSLPNAELRENTTWDLVSDIEKLRSHLGIDQWAVFGGSWGSTLSLAYSQTHPKNCTGLILRGIFLLRQKELKWFYQEGASNIFPDAWEDYLKPIPVEERQDLLSAYYKRLTSNNKSIQIEAARAWVVWEARTSKLFPDITLSQRFSVEEFVRAFARIECHYFVNKGFFKQEDLLIKNVDRISHIPAVIVQGRYDMVCPMVSAWELHQAWPEAELIVVPDAGHSMSEPGIMSNLIETTDKFANLY
ncbi:Proline iminopeptidase [Richelia intracellularis HH01]|uniref:Proline iminopeptidase n=1 Tax=Richelia intracellularis HH01 TaxID=1165094 RepID=M1WXF4_9NOST|nr:prolyl aminopeptidase [Richelia intracellularis]CCH66302.1 Proline iminopeptidase [Richelia intracellularis HH01]HAE05392.1 prolyl aminopeptidase [Richelia sp.]